MHLVFFYSLFRKYLNKQQLAIPDDLRKECNRQVKEAKEIHPGVFDNVQAAVEQLISQTTYPNFLKSDLYLQHVQLMQVKYCHVHTVNPGISYKIIKVLTIY